MFPYLKSGLFEALRNQLEIHLNIKSTGTMLEDELFTEIQDNENDYQEYYEGNADAFDDYLSRKVYHVHAHNVILKAFSNLFNCTVVIKLSDGSASKTIKNSPNLPTVFIRVEESDEFSSVHRRNEAIGIYKSLTNQSFVFDNYRRAHLHTPHSGPVQVFIRAQKFNSTTAATHISDLLPVLSCHVEAGKSVFCVLSDNSPDFNPKLLINAFSTIDFFVT